MCPSPRLLVLILCLSALPLFARQTIPRPQLEARRVTESIVLDGVLSEAIWQCHGFTHFVQDEPNEGAPPTQRTEVWIAYDDQAIYVAGRMHDTAPDSIMQVLARRDAFQVADWFGFYVDPYYDRRSGYYFIVSAGGTMLDGVMYNDDWDDDTWDGVWEGHVTIDDHGWSAEMRIPFSQLRFHERTEYVWGVNLARMVGRNNEEDYVVYRPRGENGFVSRFADLRGITAVSPPAQVELLPYIRTRAEYLQADAGNPFNDGSRYVPGVGGDLKVGLGANLTLDATINPDFGQVEVDPAVVNLSDFETFYPEKRPFFVEGMNTYRFGLGGLSNYWSFNWGDPNLFYSRRIGKAPSGSLPDNDYADVPFGTTILGAAKVTGNLGSNLNFGTAHSLTGKSIAEISSQGTRSRVEVEPLTYYGVVRTQKEFNEGRQGFGGIATYTRRFFDDPRLQNEMSRDALVAGLDGWTAFDEDRTWGMSAYGAFTTVRGTPERLTELQYSSGHYYQRPDADHVSIDSSATSMSGYVGRVVVAKQKGSVMFNAALGVISPGFEVNDLGYTFRTDVVNMHLGTGYRWTEPGLLFRQAELGIAAFQSYDFGGTNIWRGIFHFGGMTFHNFWGLSWHYAYNPWTYDNRRTRGGPLVHMPPGWEFGIEVNTDSRKQIEASLSFSSYMRSNEPEVNFEVGVQWKPSPSFRLSFNPGFSKDRSLVQWVTNVDDATASATYGARYVFATIDQTTFSGSVRLSWTFSPKLSFQLYAQPLISAGHYHAYKELAQPSSYFFTIYGEGASTITPILGSDGAVEEFEVNPDGLGPAPTFRFGNPDFNIKSLRGSAVLRWEYLPGSVVYFVWTQNRADVDNSGEFRFRKSLSTLVDTQADNVFMIKLTYWFSM
jgi:hypothetical protein